MRNNFNLGPTGVPQGDKKWGNCVKFQNFCPPKYEAFTALSIVSLFQHTCSNVAFILTKSYKIKMIEKSPKIIKKSEKGDTHDESTV